MTKSQTIFSAGFWKLCFNAFFFFLSFNMILPELIIFIGTIGGEKYVGWVIAVFTLTAFLSRPFSGKIADNVGRKWVMMFGSGVAALCSLLYIGVEETALLIGGVITPVFVFLLVRFLHGMSTGFNPTGASAYLADIVPNHKRGEALGWLGFAGSLGMAAGPSIGAWINLRWGYDVMFIVSSVMAIISMLFIWNMVETLPKERKKRFTASTVLVRVNDFYEPVVLVPTVAFTLYAFAFGAIYTLIPLRTEYLGIGEYRGLFFTVYVGFTTFTRIVAGKISDKKGREPVILAGLALIVIALLILGMAKSLFPLLLGGIFFGLAHGIVGPTVSAWVADKAHEKRRGRAFSTMYMGMELGIGAGALISAYLYNNSPDMFFPAFAVMAFLNVLAFVVVWRALAKQKRLDS
ncbi:MAG: MFS transporter [Weeksellaceae bacterium]|nr:MFS transporter [Weeksellaceae bacterium]